MERFFSDRHEAGRFLASKLRRYRAKEGVVVLGLPRGGVPVAYEVAQALELPMDVFVVKKLGLPGNEELALGAIATGGMCVINEAVVREAGLSAGEIDRVIRRESVELERRERLYREGPPLEVKGKTVLLVDDGLATGSTMSAAVLALKKRGAGKIVVAVPVGAPDTCEELEEKVDDMICTIRPEPFYAVGAWYEDFRPTTDDEVRGLLHREHARAAP